MTEDNAQKAEEINASHGSSQDLAKAHTGGC